MRLIRVVLGGVLMCPSLARGATGHDLSYALTRVDDPNPDVRASVFQVCRMTSWDGVKTIEQFLAADANKPSADSRRQLQQIVERQHAARKHLHERYLARRQWLGHITLDAYERVGSKNDKWNDSARDAIKLFYAQTTTVDEQNRLSDDMRGFAQQQCDDPLVFMLYTIWAKKKYNLHADQRVPHYLKEATKLEGSAYPASLKILGYAAYLNAIYDASRQSNQPIGPGPRQSVEHYRDAMLALVTPAIKDDGMDENDLFEDMNSCMQACQSVGIERKDTTDRVATALKAAFGEDSGQVKEWQGEFLIDYAWDARGGGWASSVGEEQWKVYNDRITAASDALQASWTKDPLALRGRAAERMIVICMAQSAPDAVREQWFQRVFEADPDNLDACYTEMNAVDPRWSGDDGGRLATLAREFELSGNEDAGIPLAVGGVYWALAKSTVHSDGTAVNHPYFQKPEIWETISRIYAPYLDRHPTDGWARNRYVMYAAAANHWDIVQTQADLLDGYPDDNIYYGDNDDYFRVWKLVAARLNKPQ